MSSYPNILSPIKIGKHIFRNRIEAAPTIFTALALIPGISEKVFRMIEDRAKGGCASVINGEISVNFDDSLRPIVLGKGNYKEVKVDYNDYNTSDFATLKQNAENIKKHGAIAIAELSHFGMEKPLLKDGIKPLGPVEFVKPDGTPVRAFCSETMQKVQNDFATSAAYMQAAGYDGVFLHYGHGWMVGQFLSPLSNLRTDEYGGSIENRSRFPLQILEAVRERCGEDFLIEIRLSGSENLEGGISLEDTVNFCKMLEGKGLVDLIHISAGHYYSPARTNEFSTIFRKHAINADYAAAVKKVVSIPVAVIGGITTPEDAERIIAEGRADIVSMGRQMIADPDFAKKLFEDRAEEIRSCLRCCICYPGPTGEHETDPPGRVYPPLGSCTINPYSVNSFSHHAVYPEDMPKPEGSRNVLIVGGGPGGMQAAIDATDRGHNVILADDFDRLGGVLRLTDFDFYKQDLYKFKDLLVREVEKRNIDVRLNTRVTPEILKEISPDALILAIGADHYIPPISGIEKSVKAFDTYFMPDSEIGKKVIMIGGGLVGCEVGLELVKKGHEVVIVEMAERLVAESIGIHRTALLDHMSEVGISYVVNTKCKEIKADGIIAENTKGEETVIKGDTVVIALGFRPKAKEGLKEAAGDISVYEIGDCVRAGKVGEAIQEGYMAAMSIV